MFQVTPHAEHIRGDVEILNVGKWFAIFQVTPHAEHIRGDLKSSMSANGLQCFKSPLMLNTSGVT